MYNLDGDFNEQLRDVVIENCSDAAIYAVEAPTTHEIAQDEETMSISENYTVNSKTVYSGTLLKRPSPITWTKILQGLIYITELRGGDNLHILSNGHACCLQQTKLIQFSFSYKTKFLS